MDGFLALKPRRHQQPRRPHGGHMPRDRQKPSALLSLRTMVIIAISLIVGIGAGGLTYWYLSPGNPPAAAVAAAAALAGSVKFRNDIGATDASHTTDRHPPSRTPRKRSTRRP